MKVEPVCIEDVPELMAKIEADERDGLVEVKRDSDGKIVVVKYTERGAQRAGNMEMIW